MNASELDDNETFTGNQSFGRYDGDYTGRNINNAVFLSFSPFWHSEFPATFCRRLSG